MLAMVALHAQPQWQVMDKAVFMSGRSKFVLPFRYQHKYRHNIMRDIWCLALIERQSKDAASEDDLPMFRFYFLDLTSELQLNPNDDFGQYTCRRDAAYGHAKEKAVAWFHTRQGPFADTVNRSRILYREL
ncbi:hypothetical protein PG984_014126 [Apiospora sp. TS-2023a]